MRRRDFLIAGSMSAAALSVAARADATQPNTTQAQVLGADAAVAASGGPTSLDAHAIVYEPRYPAARELAQRHAGHGAHVFAADECMVRLWRGRLAELVSRGETRIAGFTSYSDFGIARDCARDQGLRVLHESWCRDTPVSLIHWLIGT